jgi:hypothetical protein
VTGALTSLPAVALERTAEELQMRAQQRSIVTLIGQQAIPDSNFGEEIDRSGGVSFELAP